jgi:hypothetical protein
MSPSILFREYSGNGARKAFLKHGIRDHSSLVPGQGAVFFHPRIIAMAPSFLHVLQDGRGAI